MNMLDLIKSAQGGNGVGNLARQFGLGPAETESVLRQVLPAMSAGFKQKTRRPGGLAEILQGVQGTEYEEVYENPRALERADIRSRGNDVLGQIFGDKEISRHVARKTEQNAGVGEDTVKKMLPVIASMIMGGMQRRASTDTAVGDGVGEIVAGLLGSGGSTKAPKGSSGLDSILRDALGQGDGGRTAQPRREAPSPGGLGGILGGLLGRKRQQEPVRHNPRREAKRDGNLDDMLGGIFGTAPKRRQSTGDPRLDSVIGMFDADGDGEVDMDVLRRLSRGR